MFANFQSNGTTPLDNDSMNIRNNGLAKVSAQSFNMFGCIPSLLVNFIDNHTELMFYVRWLAVSS